jgi:hypothetical protein
MNHMGGIGIAWFMLSGYPGPHTWLSTHDLCGGYHLGCTCGRPPRNKEIIMSSVYRVLPVQPYDIMGSVLIEYNVRVQLVA